MSQYKSLGLFVVVLAVAGLTGACSRESEPPLPAPIVGGDRDAHGCIGSAGYSWCEKQAECVQPWELAKQAGFELNEANFNDYCGNPPG